MKRATVMVLLGLGLALPARAVPVAALEFDSVSGVGTHIASPVVVGWTFDVNTAVDVVSLGAVLDKPVWASGTFPTQVTVGLWDPAGTLLAQSDVDTSDVLDGHFYYRDIAPVSLAAGTGYTVAALWPTNQGFAHNVVNPATQPEITYGEARYLESATLDRPTSANAFFGAATGEFGGSFRIEAVPEPGSLALLGLSAVMVFRRRRR